jgi:MFS family permease
MDSNADSLGRDLLLAGIGCVCLAPMRGAAGWARVAGVGGGCMWRLGYALIPTWLRADKTGAALGWLVSGGRRSMAGAPVGGLLTSLLSWRWALLATVVLPVDWCFCRVADSA